MGVVSVCVWGGGGFGGLFLPCLNTRFCSRVSGQRRRDENAQMVTKAFVLDHLGAHSFVGKAKPRPGRVKRRLLVDVIIPPRALPDTGADGRV